MRYPYSSCLCSTPLSCAAPPGAAPHPACNPADQQLRVSHTWAVLGRKGQPTGGIRGMAQVAWGLPSPLALRPLRAGLLLLPLFALLLLIVLLIIAAAPPFEVLDRTALQGSGRRGQCSPVSAGLPAGHMQPHTADRQGRARPADPPSRQPHARPLPAQTAPAAAPCPDPCGRARRGAAQGRPRRRPRPAAAQGVG